MKVTEEAQYSWEQFTAEIAELVGLPLERVTADAKPFVDDELDSIDLAILVAALRDKLGMVSFDTNIYSRVWEDMTYRDIYTEYRAGSAPTQFARLVFRPQS
jgi:acyl carrier protein